MEKLAEITTTPTQAFTLEQIKRCRDCGGSGMYYPEGYEKGVGKGKHEKS